NTIRLYEFTHYIAVYYVTQCFFIAFYLPMMVGIIAFCKLKIEYYFFLVAGKNLIRTDGLSILQNDACFIPYFVVPGKPAVNHRMMPYLMNFLKNKRTIFCC